jgi:hypothetical protein
MGKVIDDATPGVAADVRSGAGASEPTGPDPRSELLPTGKVSDVATDCVAIVDIDAGAFSVDAAIARRGAIGISGAVSFAPTSFADAIGCSATDAGAPPGTAETTGVAGSGPAAMEEAFLSIERGTDAFVAVAAVVDRLTGRGAFVASGIALSDAPSSSTAGKGAPATGVTPIADRPLACAMSAVHPGARLGAGANNPGGVSAGF